MAVLDWKNHLINYVSLSGLTYLKKLAAAFINGSSRAMALHDAPNPALKYYLPNHFPYSYLSIKFSQTFYLDFYTYHMSGKLLLKTW